MLMDFFNELQISEQRTIIITQVFAIVLATVIANFVANKFINRVAKKAEKTSNLWDDALVYALRKPLRLLLWLIGLTLATEAALSSYESLVVKYIGSIREVGVIFAATWGILRFIKSVEQGILHPDKSDEHIAMDKTTASAVAKLIRISVIITSCLIMMQTLGFSISGVLAFGGIGGMAIALAAKDMLANFFGALMIYFDKPFKVGDWIRSPDKEIEGTVEDIGWRRTLIRTFDKRPIYVPNAVFSTITVENPSRMTNRRINEYFGVRYDDIKQVNAITSDVETMLKKHKEIDAKQTLMVHLDRFSESSVDFFIYTFTKTTDWVKFHGIKQEIMLKIAAIIEKHGAECAFPTTTVHIPENIGFAKACEIEKSVTKVE